MKKIFTVSNSIVFVLALLLTTNSTNAQVAITAATGGANISADNAANATTPAYTTLGKIVVKESANNAFAFTANTAVTFVLNAPAGWAFNPGVGTVGFAATMDISSAVPTITASSITITITPTGGNVTNQPDSFFLSGIQVRATDGGAAPTATSQIYRPTTGGGTFTTAGVPGITTTNNTDGLGGTNFGSLSQALGAMSKLVVVLPTQTFTDAATAAASGLSGSVTTQTAGISFNITKLVATDQFFNVITTYSGAKTISYSGPGNALTNPTYTTAVSFTSGQSTTTLATNLKKAETTTITASDGTISGPASSSLTVQPNILNNFLVENFGGGNIPTQAAGTPFNIRITARDANNNTLSSGTNLFSGTVNITSTGTLTSGSGTTAAFSNGVLASHSVTISPGGNFTITATRTAGSETGTSNAFNVTNPSPTLSSISPSCKLPGDPGFTMTLTGTGFNEASVGRIDGSARTTTYINSTTLDVQVLASDIINAGSYNITVFNPTPGGGTSSAKVLTVTSPTAISVQPVGATLCTGATANFSVTASGAGLTYQWRRNTIDIGSANSSTYSISNVTTADNGTYDVVIGSTCYANIISDPAVLTVDPTSVGGTVNSSATVCTGSNSGTLTLSGETGSIVKWEFSTDGGSTWNDIVNTTNTQNYLDITQTTRYRAVVQSGVCASANSSVAIITVSPLSEGGTVAGSTTICSTGNSGTLTLSGHTGTVVKWEFSTDGGNSWTDIINTTTSQSYLNLTQTTLYHAIVQSSPCSADTSDDATITVQDPPNGGSVTPDATVCSGSNSGTLTLGGNTGTITKWQFSVNAGSTWTDISNTTSNQGYSNLTQTTWYRAVLEQGTCINIFSAPAIITVDPVTVGGSISGSATVCFNANSGTLTLSGHTGNVVKWEYSEDGGGTWTDIVNTSTTQNYTNLIVETKYRATVQSGVCASEVSATATIMIAATSVGGSVGDPATVCTGSNGGTLTLTGHSGSIIKWQSSIDGGTTWDDITNTTTTQNYLNLTQTTMYRAVVQSGPCVAANSSEVTITVDPASVGGTLSGSTAVCTGTNSGTLTLGTHTGSIVKWQFSTDGGSTWNDITNTTNTQSYTNLTITTRYRVVVQSGVCSPTNSSLATITVSPLSVGGTVGTSTNVCSGSNSGTLTLTGHSGNISKWQSSVDGGANWVDIANTTTSLNYLNITQTTMYRAVVQSGACTAANSVAATLTVDAASVGGSVTSNATVCSGTNSGTLNLSGHTGMVVKWQSSIDGGANWNDIANTGTSQTYNNLTQTTTYRAVVQNGSCPSANSSAATITVDPVSVGGSVGSSATVCSGTNSGALTLTGKTGNVLRWEFSTDGGTIWNNIVNTGTTQSYTNLTQTTMYRAVVQSGVCAPANSSAATITVNPVSVGGSVTSSATVCTGANSGTLTLSGHTGTVVKWQFSTNGGGLYTDIANTTTTQNYLNLTQTTLYRAVVQSGVCATANSAAATITVSPAAVGGTVSGSTTVCATANSGSMTLSGHTGTISKWQFSTDGGANWTDIANTTTTQGYTNLTQTRLYRAVVVNGACTANSSNATITVNPTSVGGTAGPDQQICRNSAPADIILSASVGSVTKWEMSTSISFPNGSSTNDIAVTSTTLPGTTIGALIQTTYFRAYVKSGVCTEVTSSIVTVTVDPLSVGGTLSGSATVCSGTNSGSMTLSGQTGTIIKWQFSIDGGTNWTDIANTTNTQSYSNLTINTLYRVEVKSGVCASAFSANATITVNPESVGGTVGSDASVCTGINSGILTLTGHTGSVIRWQRSTDGGANYSNISNTTTTQSYSNLTTTTLYRAQVQSGICPIANSFPATITVNPTSVGGTLGGSTTVCISGNSGTLTLSGHTGTIIKWQFSTDGGGIYNDIANTTTTYNYSNLLQTTLFRVIVQSGVCASTVSSVATVTVSPLSVGGSTGTSTTVCSGSNSGSISVSGHTGKG